ncbi:MAG: type III-A CRISPR-associated protein Cas10/Csm1 [Candidatus Heimdallarchaeaceae archaeon]
MSSQVQGEFDLNAVREVEIASLFHDIGKFIQHTNQKITKKHAELAFEALSKINFPKGLNKDRILKLIKSHHDEESKILGQIEVKSGDWIAAAMEREKDESKEANRPLQSIFSVLKLGKEEQTESSGIAVLTPQKIDIEDKETIFPRSKDIPTNKMVKISEKTWNEFYNKLKSIPPNVPYSQWISTVEALMRIYCYNILSAGYQTVPTVSLYHHLTTAAAIARNKMQYNLVTPTEKRPDNLQEELRYLIIKGDIQGIQNFIFNVHSPDKVRKEASKRLRGRSFVIQLLAMSIVSQILDELELSEISVLSNAAGNFTIIAPNTKEIREKIANLKKEIAKELIAKYNDKLRVTISEVEASDEDLRNYKKLQQKVAKRLNIDKKRPNTAFLFNDGLNWNEEEAVKYFAQKTPPEGFSKCSVCEIPMPRNTEEEICEECQKHQKIGEKLPKIEYIVQVPIKEGKVIKELSPYEILKYNYYFVTDEELKRLANSNIKNGTIYCLDPKKFEKLDINEYISKFGVSFQFFGIIVPKYHNVPLSFDALCEASIGLKRLGIFKADVDNLGQIFSKGIVGQEEKLSVAHAKDISTRIDLFFSGYTMALAQKTEFRLWFKVCEEHKKYFIEFEKSETLELPIYRYNDSKKNLKEIKRCPVCNDPNNYTTAIYSVFSGGDDLVFIGPWDMMIEFANMVNKEFQSYVANNPHFTISAGLGLFEQKFPVAIALRDTEELLEQSKTVLLDKSGNPLKNSITLFGETVVWSRERAKRFEELEYGDFSLLYETGKFLEEAIKTEPKLTRGTAIYLLQLWQRAFSEFQRFEDIQEHRLKTFVYYPQLAYYLARRFKGGQREKIDHYFDKFKKVMPWIRIPASWAYYRTKGLEKENKEE